MARRTTSELEIEGKRLQLSNLEKVMFPSNGFTKAQVIDYYIRVSPVLIPHVKDRPLTLKRFPDGIEGAHFYEKDAPSYKPDWVEVAPVPRKGTRKIIRYCLANNLPTLVWLANLANLEMHVLLSRRPRIDVPTWMVFDLDPGPPAGVLECAQVALWIKQILDSMELQCFAKSSGSKGIQLYVPLNTNTDYDTTSEFSKSIAEFLARRHPELVVAKMAKQLRGGKVFIDWSQNSDFKTTVAVYSLRAKREIPYISMPVTWDELSMGLSAQDRSVFYYEPEAALKRIEKVGDLFEPLLHIRQKLPARYDLESLASKPVRPVRKTSSRKKAAKGDTSIKAYNAKRDFGQTQEPPGSVEPKAKKEGWLYVIQKHEASRLHYDFRLEMDGVLRSWAVPKGPPTGRNEKRLAMHVEDHPMSYARFEGTIPEGNYGAGTVMVWDIGTYKVLDKNPVADYYAGKLHLLLDGKKLKGEWVLVKVPDKRDPQKNSWFLIKVNAEHRAISAKVDDQSALTGRTMKQIEQENDAQWISNRPSSKSSSRSGRTKEPEINLRNLPKASPKFIDPMLAKLAPELPSGPDWIYEVKLDGYRALAVRNKNKIELISRNGKNLNRRFPEIVAAVEELPSDSFTLDGEVIALDGEGRPSFQALQNLRSGEEGRALLYFAFDLLHFDGKDLTRLPLVQRKQALDSFIGQSSDIVRFSMSIEGDAEVLIREAKKNRLEGIIAKRQDSLYESGKRTGAWIKFKTNRAQEFVIGGYKRSGGKQDFESILVGCYEHSKLIYAAKVRSGFTSHSKKELGTKFEKLITNNCPFTNLPEGKGGRWGEGLTKEDMEKCVWLKPQLVCQVDFTEWTSSGHLRHPVYIGLREEKRARDVVRETV